MGLSERKQKQRISYDPRNLTWSDDKDRFSYKHMKSLGWTDASGIGGASLTGNAKHIAVVHKLDSAGIGMGRAMKEGDEMGGQARAGLDEVLRRLASASAAASAANSAVTSPSASPAPEGIKAEDGTPVRVRNKIASRQRHLQAKRLASSSPAALAEILGIAAPLSPSPLPDIIVKTEPGLVDVKPIIAATTPQREAEDMVTTSTVSVSDYFRQKMRAKMLARQGASGSSTPVEPGSPVASGSNTPATEWEGTKVEFTEVNASEPLAFTESADDVIDTIPAANSAESDDKEASKEERRAAKKAKKEAKEAKRAAKAEKQADRAAAANKGVPNEASRAKGDKRVRSDTDVEVVEAQRKKKRKDERKKREAGV